MYIIPWKLNSTLGMIGKAMDVKMTVKAVGKNSSRVSMKNNLNMQFMQQSTSAKF